MWVVGEPDKNHVGDQLRKNDPRQAEDHMEHVGGKKSLVVNAEDSLRWNLDVAINAECDQAAVDSAGGAPGQEVCGLPSSRCSWAADGAWSWARGLQVSRTPPNPRREPTDGVDQCAACGAGQEHNMKRILRYQSVFLEKRGAKLLRHQELSQQ